MGRTQDILGRVWGNLKSYGIPSYNKKEELLDDLRQGIKKIYILARLEKKVPITLTDGVASYDFKIGNSIVSSVKEVIPPSSWKDKTITFVPESDWNKVKKGKSLGTYPIYGIIFSNQLHLHPVPASGVDGDIIEFLCLTAGTDGTIAFTDNNEPDVPDIFDDALEYFVTARNLTGKDKIEFMNLFQNEIRENRPAVHRKAGVEKRRAY